MNFSFQTAQTQTKKGSTFDLDAYEPMPVAQQLRGAILHRIRAKLPVLPEIDGREEAKADVMTRAAQ
ncbi:MAG: hypothetical protein HY667_04175 [Chloroflexi bacterium]|nr:hypothetical protein [Chloroflexota bacterium]